MGNDVYDVAIVGAGPAGAIAALRLAQKEYSVALIDHQAGGDDTASLGWLNARAAPLLAELRVDTKRVLDQRFDKVAFCSADFSKMATPTFTEAPGYIIDRSVLSRAMLTAAAKSKVAVSKGCEASDVQLRESSVIVETDDGREIVSKLLLLAPGRRSGLPSRAGFARRDTSSVIWTTQLNATVKPDFACAVPSVYVILGLDKSGSFAMLYRAGKQVSIGLNWTQGQGTTIPVLVNICRAAYASDVLPVDLSSEAAKVEAVASPSTNALDMETHVGKHTLLLGDAGGFVSVATSEGMYPSMWSAEIAVGVADTALHSVHSQEALMTFDSQWRIEMADYLRAPNTDTQFLLPLIFSNQPMADRMGAAFFAGENI
jgi:flavin-dependent dehydrogenase